MLQGIRTRQFNVFTELDIMFNYLSQRIAAARTYLANCRVCTISRKVFWEADTTTIRMSLALASMGWVYSLLARHDLLQTYPYQIMGAIAPASIWASLFTLYFIGVFWRIFDPVRRVRWALAINALGVLLWITVTLCLNLRTGRFVPGSSLEIVTCLFAGWAMIRTGNHKEVVTS